MRIAPFSALARWRRLSAILATASLLAAPSWAGAAESISVVVDQAKLIKLPANVATLVVGNPLIADVTLQAGGTMVVTGKGYGATNVVALDRAGSVLSDQMVLVEGPTGQLVTVYKGIERESYSCTPICQRRTTLGDSNAYFSSAIDQVGNLANRASGIAAEARVTQ